MSKSTRDPNFRELCKLINRIHNMPYEERKGRTSHSLDLCGLQDIVFTVDRYSDISFKHKMIKGRHSFNLCARPGYVAREILQVIRDPSKRR